MNKPLNALKGKERAFAIESLEELFNEVDGGKDDAMNKIIWFYKRGDEKYPVVKRQTTFSQLGTVNSKPSQPYIYVFVILSEPKTDQDQAQQNIEALKDPSLFQK